MSIRKRTWNSNSQSAKNGIRTAWVLDYFDVKDGKRVRHTKAFPTKGAAQEYLDKIKPEIRAGTHVSERDSMLIAAAGKLWLARCEADQLEQSTQDQYEQHLRLHIVPFVKDAKLAHVTVPFVRRFQDWLTKEDRSPAMVRGVIGSLGALLADAQERGLVGHNSVRELRKRRVRGGAQSDKRGAKLKVGVDIPTPDEVRAIINAAQEMKAADEKKTADEKKSKWKWKPFMMVAIFTGLRASEMRGLRWEDVDLKPDKQGNGKLHVTQRADFRNRIGAPKSKAGTRTVPLPPEVLKELREWKMRCPKQRNLNDPEDGGRQIYVFPNGQGHIESHPNILQRGLHPTMIAAGVTKPVLDENDVAKRDKEGKPIVEPKYSGLHSLRHFYASWCINRKEDKGLGLPPKIVQTRMGHSSIVMTLDTYGHLFPSGDDTGELAAAEKVLLGY